MQRRWLALAGLAVTLTAGTTMLVSANAQDHSFGKGAPERHPEMMRALRTLERAKSDLQHADHDFGGHRVKALDATNTAIAEVKEALKFDSK